MEKYILARSVDDVKKYLKDAKVISFDFETAPDDNYRDQTMAAIDAHKSHIVGVSFSVEEGTGIYAPIAHKNTNLNLDMIKILREFAESDAVKIAHNLPFEAMFLYANDILIQPPVYDTILAAMMTLKTKTEFRTLSDSGLKTIVPQLLHIDLPTFSEVTDGRHFDELNPEDYETIRYACADSDYALQLYNLINAWFDKYLPRHRWIIENIESPTAIFVGIMKYNGVSVDKALMYQKQFDAGEKIIEIHREIKKFIGEDIDIGANASTDAFKKYLYEDLKLPVLKTTAKYQAAADEESLILLKDWCRVNKPEILPLLDLIHEYRKWNKIKSTYIDGFIDVVNSETGKIHTSFFQLGTDTGRFASRTPNMQNCFDDMTEILTMDGFKKFKDLSADDYVAQWQDGKVEFVMPIETICQPYQGDMYYIHNQHINLCMTPEHRCLLQNRKTKEYIVCKASEYREDYRQLHSGIYEFGDIALTEEQIIILAATQADGNFHDGGIDFVFSKARKYRRLISTIRKYGAKHSDTVKKNGQVRIRLFKDCKNDWIYNFLDNKKRWKKDILYLTKDNVYRLLKELNHWDGCFTRDNAYSSSVESNVDWMQILYVLSGIRAHKREYWNGGENANINYQLDVTNRNYSLTTNVKKEVITYDGNVYCVSVPSGYIVVRRRGQVCITGNCPRKDNDPVGIRSFLKASDGHIFVDFDFSQIELRVGSWYCRDKKMLETYMNDGDIHAQTTSVIYNIPFEEATNKNAEHYKERRSIAKNCNFGVFYGLFPNGLMRNLKKAGIEKTKSECAEIIQNLKNGYPMLSTWQDMTKNEAINTGYSETAFGRRRILKGIYSPDMGTRSYWQRCALNTPIQGTAADILKLAMVRILAQIKEHSYIKPLLTIHDEILFEVPVDKKDEACSIIKSCMEQQPFPEFDVPLKAEGAVGYSFGDMEEL